MSYGGLSDAFPWVMQSDRGTVRYMVGKLTDPKRYLDDNGNGSSFAVTVDAPTGKWNLWLSDVSKEYLVQYMQHLIAIISPTH